MLFKQKASQLLLRPSIDISSMIKHIPKVHDALNHFDKESLEQAEIQIKYEAYIEKEKQLAQRIGQLDSLSIPENFNYDKISALSAEAFKNLKK